MLKNYILIAFRNLRKYKIYSLINVFGLALGMASCILILLYVQDELSYDQYHENADRIYRVSREWKNDNGETSLHLGQVAPPIAPLLEKDYPEVLLAVRMIAFGGLVSYENKHFDESNFYFADPEFFEIFTLPLLAGDPTTVLKEPGNIVITDEMAQKYFGMDDPIGKVIVFRGQFPLKVAGVMKKMPRNSHFHADFLGSMLALQNAYGDMEFQSWGSNNYATYLLLPEDYLAEELIAKFPGFLDEHLTARIIQATGQPPAQKPSERNFLHLQRLTDIHLHSHLDSELEPNGNIIYVYIFSAVAFFLLLIACINFMNLATARSANRAKEVGLRKVVGADRKGLIRQFIGESIFMAAVSLVIAIAFVYLALPWFSGFVEKELSLNLFDNLTAIAGLIGIILFVGFVAGSYPALFLSRFQPATVLKGNQSESTSKSPFRMALVVFQFAISIILIIGMGVVNDQLEYCRSKDLGLVKENVIVLPASQTMIQRYADFKNQLLLHPTIVSVAASKRVPSGRLLDSSGAFVVDGENRQRINFRIANVRVDHDFIDTYNIELAAGRNFSVEYPTD
ncbi:MAG: ABC transporter permease, partial [bacterium]